MVKSLCAVGARRRGDRMIVRLNRRDLWTLRAGSGRDDARRRRRSWCFSSGRPARRLPPFREQEAAIRARPLRDLGTQEAYAAALERDTLDGYSEFLTAYPDDPMAARVRAIAAARREALTWRRSRLVDTPPAYWSYLRRYPQGPARGGCAPAPGLSCRRLRAAAVVRGHRL